MVALDAALAGLGIGRKFCRQLRAELRLEDDSFHCLLRCFLRDQRRVESALCRLVPKAAEQVISLLEAESLETSAAEAVPGDSESGTISPVSPANQPCGGFEEVWRSLPRLVPGGPSSERQGQEERSRALRRRLKAALPEEGQQAIKAQQVQLREEGLLGADRYITEVWKHLELLDPLLRVALMVDLITSQAYDVQRALRSAVERRKTAPTTRCRSTAAAPVRCGKGDLLELPEAYLLQMLSYCGSASVLAAIGASSLLLRSLAENDKLWREVWHLMRLPRQLPESQVRRHFLMCLASQCVECGELTDFEHAILGCRLCETCERRHSRYALIRSSLAIREFQLPLSAMQQLPGVDGSTGRVFLRSMVEQLAERQHTQESLQQLRAKNDLGHSTCGRQRREKPGEKRRHANNERNGMPKPSKEDTDPCCFEATALRRANDPSELEEGRLRLAKLSSADLPRSLRRNLLQR